MYKHKLTIRVILLFFMIAAISCRGNSKKTEENVSKQEASLIEASIGGMSCLGCEQTIQKNVSGLEGIKSIKASFTAGNAIIEYFPDQVDTLKIREVVTGSGYKVNKFIQVKPEEAINPATENTGRPGK